jgi:hypothetical protein
MSGKRREARKEILKHPTSIEKRAKYRILNKGVKNAVRKTKTHSFNEKVKLIEEQYKNHDSHNLFKNVREMEGKPKKSLSAVKDSNGQKHFQLDKVLVLWKEYFENHLNTSFEHDINALDTLTPIQTEAHIPEPEVSKDEVRTSIRKMKMRKAPGSDEITTEVIRAGGEKMVDMLCKIFNIIMATNKTPIAFSKMIVTPIHKKGD